jgi:hypothetical protein
MVGWGDMIIDETDTDFSKPGLVFVICRLEAETPKALLLGPFLQDDFRSIRKVWLPKEGLKNIERFRDKSRQTIVTFYIHRYTAETKGLKHYERKDQAPSVGEDEGQHPVERGGEEP